MKQRAFICSVGVLVLIHTVCSKKELPSIITPNKQITEYIQPGTTYTMNCSADGSPEPRYRWTFNGTAIKSDNMKVNDTIGDLTIEKFSDQEEGNYQCFAENTDAVAMSALITLRKAKLGFAWPPSSTPSVTAKEGGYVNLTCDNPPDSVPDGQYSWQLNQVDASEREVKKTNRIHIDAKGTLHFVYVEQEDQSDMFQYKCGIRNSKLDVIKLGGSKQLTVEAPVGALLETGVKTQFSTSKEAARFLIATDAELECVFSGYPIPNITWFDNSSQITATKDKYDILDFGRKLVVKNLEEKDEKKYTCKGENLKGSNQTSIYLDVKSGPIWVKGLTPQTVPEGEDAMFTCIARTLQGEKDLDAPTWYKNGQNISVSDTPKYQFTDKGRVLTVKNLTKTSDIACFQCSVQNKEGYEFGHGCLDVIEPIVITTQPNLTQQISKGDQVDLTVIGETDPAYNLTYRWYFRNEIYEGDESPPFVIFNQTTMQAYINTSELSDEEYMAIRGTYIRELFHTDDRLNVSVVVLLVPVRAAAVDLWWIALIVALVILIIVVILIVVICNRKKKEGIYPLAKKERASAIDPEKDLADSSFHDLAKVPKGDEYPDQFDDLDDMYSDDEKSLVSQGGDDDESTFFNEDGSFIGVYRKRY